MKYRESRSKTSTIWNALTLILVLNTKVCRVLSEDNENTSVSLRDEEETTNHEIPYSEHEEPKEIATKPKYIAPGEWAKAVKDKNANLNFVPTKLYAQVRGTETVKRVARGEAGENAENDEEKLNAPRLRKVITNDKVFTVYTEEGYEDSGYDHAGQITDADYHEGSARKLHDRLENEKTIEDGDKRSPEEKYKPKYEENLQEFRDNEEGGVDESEEKNALSSGEDSDDVRYSNVNPKQVVKNGVERLKKNLKKEFEEEEEKAENEFPDGRAFDSKRIQKLKKYFNNSRENDSKVLGNYSPRKKGMENLPPSLSQGEEKEDNSYKGNYDSTTKPVENNFYWITPAIHEITTDRVSPQSHRPHLVTDSYGDVVQNFFAKARENEVTTVTESSPLAERSSINSPVPPRKASSNNNEKLHLLGEELAQQEALTTAVPLATELQTYPHGFAWNHANSKGTFSTVPDIAPQSRQNERLNFIRKKPSGSLDKVSTNEETWSYSPVGFRASAITSDASAGNISEKRKEGESEAETEEALPHLAHRDNPFSSPLLRDAYADAAQRKKTKYRVLVRHAGIKSEKKKTAAGSAPWRRSRKNSSTQYSPTKRTERQEEESAPELQQRNEETSDERHEKTLGYAKKRKNDEASVKKGWPLINNRRFKPGRNKGLGVAGAPVADELGPEESGRSNFPVGRLTQSGKSFESERTPTVTGTTATTTTAVREPTEKKLWNEPSRYPVEANRSAFFTGTKLFHGDRSLPFLKSLSSPPLPSPRSSPAPRFPLFFMAFRYYPSFFRGTVGDAYRQGKGKRKKKKEEEHGYNLSSKSDGSYGTDLRDENFYGFAPSVIAMKSRETRKKRSLGLETSASSSVAKENAKGEVNNGKTNRIAQNSSHDDEVAGAERNLERYAGAVKQQSNFVASTVASNFAKSNSFELKLNGDRSSDDVESAKKYGRTRGGGGGGGEGGRRRRRSSKTHEELLNDSPKITSAVINDEIKSRFDDDDENEKKRENNAGKGLVEIPNVREIEVPTLGVDEESNSFVVSNDGETTSADPEKYPFYGDTKVADLSALKYAVDPRRVPQKSANGMAFYESRDVYKNCKEVDPNLEGVTRGKGEAPTDRGDINENLPRLRNLGDKLDCFKAKYFDENPFDNPLFHEKEVGEPAPPSELDSRKFSAKILQLSDENERQVVQKLSRKPELTKQGTASTRVERERKKSMNYQDGNSKIQGGRKNPSRTSRKLNAKIEKELNRPRRIRVSTEQPFSPVHSTLPYHKEIYEDVMSHIRGNGNPFQTNRSHRTAASNVANGKSSSANADISGIAVKKADNSKNENIEGLLPPRDPKRQSRYSKSVAYRRIPRRLRSPIGQYKRIRIYKRSASNQPNRRRTPLRLLKNNVTSSARYNESRAIVDSPSKIIRVVENERRNSKPNEDARNTGKFMDEQSLRDFDIRRKEPRYNYIRRKENRTEATTSSTPVTLQQSQPERLRTLNPEEVKAPANYPFVPKDEPGHPTSSTNAPTYAANSAEKRHSKGSNFANASIKPAVNKYEVHEDVEEDAVTSVPGFAVSKEDFWIKKYLESDPPKHDESENGSEETLKAPLPKVQQQQQQREEEESKEDSVEDLSKSTEGRTEENKEEKGIYSGSKFKKKKKKKKEKKMEKESDESSERNRGSQAKSDEEKTADGQEAKEKYEPFFRYTSRPDSSAENYQDEKYSDLGPRVNKPRFYHSPLPTLRYGSTRKLEGSGSDEEESQEKQAEKYNSSDESSDKDGKENCYTFADGGEESRSGEDDKSSESKESTFKLGSFRRYEYPWERRKRLEEERSEKRTDFPFDEDEGDTEDGERTSLSDRIKSISRPFWYRKPKRKLSYRKFFDSGESSTEHRPVFIYSSKYDSSVIKPPLTMNQSDTSTTTTTTTTVTTTTATLATTTTTESTNLERAIGNSSSKQATFFATNSVSNATETIVPKVVTPVPSKRDRKKRKRERSSGIGRTETTSAPPPPMGRQKRRKNATKKENMTKTVARGSNTSSNVDNALNATETRLNAVSMQPSLDLKTVTGSPFADSSIDKSRRRSRILFESNSNGGFATPHTDFANERGRTRFREKNRAKHAILNASPFFSRIDESRGPSKIFEAESLPEPIELSRIDSAEKFDSSTPTSKIIEHRSQISEESIITKTTYPNSGEAFDVTSNSTIAEDNAKKEKIRDLDPEDTVTKRNVEKISIMTRETPDHIFRTKRIDKDGVKKMFVSILPNNRTTFRLSKLDVEEDSLPQKKKKEDFPKISPVVHEEVENVGVVPIADATLQNRGIVKLTEHGSTNMITSVSWTAENYDY